MNTQVRPGYKLTEAGVIPEDWSSPCLGLLVHSVEYGSSAKSSLTGRIPVLRMGNLQEGKINWNDLVFTDDDREISKYLLNSGDVLFNRTNTPELVGKTAIYRGEAPAIFAGYLIRVKERKDLLNSAYLNYVLNSEFSKKYSQKVLSIAVGQANINGQKLKSYSVPLPPSLIEQEAISSALMDSDALICGLDQLIAKKRNIKQAATQQLLTGQKRLPTFSGEWDNVLVSSVISGYFSGPSPTCQERNIDGNSEWGVLKTTAATKENGWDWKKHKALPEAYWGKNNIELQAGDVIVTKAGPRHRVGVAVSIDYTPKRLIPSGKMIALRPNRERVAPLMLAAAISAKDAQIYLDQRSTGMAESQVNFENSDLLNTPIRIPSIIEQEAIACVLSDMDAELTALETRRDKARQLKQGMMQELLTGRTRLL